MIIQFRHRGRAFFAKILAPSRDQKSGCEKRILKGCASAFLSSSFARRCAVRRTASSGRGSSSSPAPLFHAQPHVPLSAT